MESLADTKPTAPATRRTVMVAMGQQSEYLPFFRNGIYEVAAREGWSILDLRYFGMKVPRGHRPDGMISRLVSGAKPLVRRVLRLGVPAVQASPLLASVGSCSAFLDQGACGRVAAEYLTKRGFRNLAYLHSEEYEHSPHKMVGQSFIERARELGAKADPIAVQRLGKVIPWHRVSLLAKRFAKEIADLSFPLGVFTYSDAMAIRICLYCQNLGLSVPDQVAVLGRGNDSGQCDHAPIPLSSVVLNHVGHGRAAAELLKRLMDGEPCPAEPVLVQPAGVITRQSTDVLAVPDFETARAMRYIWAHLSEPLGIPEIAKACRLSPSTLERRFRKYLHRSVNEEVVRKRIESGCDLLVDTELPIGDIARQVGFSTATYFFKVFRRAMGMTPRQYRLAHIPGLREADEAEPPGRE